MYLNLQRRRFEDLSEREILALAISSEEEDARIYRNFSDRLRESYPDTANIFTAMANEEDVHGQRLTEMYQARFGQNVILIRREHVRGFYTRRPIWLAETLGIARMRSEVEVMERGAEMFYRKAAKQVQDADICALLVELADAEADHRMSGADLAHVYLDGGAREHEDKKAKRQLVLTWVQPGLAGLMDGSVSTLAPVFATAFATHDTSTTFLVGLAAAVGAGISMGFAEAATDDGTLSGRGSPVKRGLASGLMTTLGGLGHALPFLISDFWTATLTAFFIVFLELWAIAWIQNRFMDTPFWRAAFQVVVGGALVFAAGTLIGSG